MALDLRPNCEYCDKDLPPASVEASGTRVHLSYSREDIAQHSARIRDVPPPER